jgi:hypothetical protein
MSNDLQVVINAEIPDLALALQAKIANTSNITIDYSLLVQFLSDFVVANKELNLELNRIKPSFESIKSQMQAYLRQKDSWRDLIQAGVGETLLEFIAAIGDYGQTSIQRAYQETSLDARLTSSIYTITRFLGVHVDRKIPSQVNVSLWEDPEKPLSGIAIPSLSQWSVNGTAFFNRDPIVINGETQDNPYVATLYQGQIQVETFLSTGTPFQVMELGFNDYRVADQDVYCFMDNNVVYERVIDGLWHYDKNDLVFQEDTTGNGNVEVTFGNSLYGKIPEINSIIAFVYALTEGSATNTTDTNLDVNLIDTNDVVTDRIKANTSNALIDAKNLLRSIQGTTTSAIFNGADEKSKEFYSALAPGIRAAGKRVVTRPDHRALGMDFPNVADVLFQGQRELNPKKTAWTNIVGVTVLKNDGTVFTADEWNSYVEYLTTLEIWRAQFIRIDPVPVYFDFYGDVYCTQQTDLVNIKSFIQSNVAEFFRPKLGIIGKSVFENDAETLYKFEYANMKVDYVQNVTPTTDKILTKIGFTPQYPVLRTFDCKTYYSTRSYNSITPKILGTI